MSFESRSLYYTYNVYGGSGGEGVVLMKFKIVLFGLITGQKRIIILLCFTWLEINSGKIVIALGNHNCGQTFANIQM